mmetsp:Transcript_12631/g.16405  ORF Transcript_12631/g.16405 Transcript_12631/m.16405 type:complete len:313 (+) Transcript_12631:202-1140(+)
MSRQAAQTLTKREGQVSSYGEDSSLYFQDTAYTTHEKIPVVHEPGARYHSNNQNLKEQTTVTAYGCGLEPNIIPSTSTSTSTGTQEYRNDWSTEPSTESYTPWSASFETDTMTPGSGSGSSFESNFDWEDPLSQEDCVRSSTEGKPSSKFYENRIFVLGGSSSPTSKFKKENKNIGLRQGNQTKALDNLNRGKMKLTSRTFMRRRGRLLKRDDICRLLPENLIPIRPRELRMLQFAIQCAVDGFAHSLVMDICRYKQNNADRHLSVGAKDVNRTIREASRHNDFYRMLRRYEDTYGTLMIKRRKKSIKGKIR